MPSALADSLFAHAPDVECGHCQGRLPLRLSAAGERGAVWLCAGCSVPFVSICIKDRLVDDAWSVRLDERYFDTDGLPAISNKLRREALKLAERAQAALGDDKRRSERELHSLVVPAVKLDASMNPFGKSFQVMVANISREGVGMVHSGPIDAEYLALKLPLDDDEPIQVVARIVRERELKKPLREFGGEFFVRLGSIAEDE